MENVALPVLASAGGYTLCLSDPRPSHRADILSLSLHQQGKEVEAVAVSPDGSLLVSGGRDGRIVLMTLMVPSIIPRSESSHMHLTSSVLRKSRVIRDRSYIYDVTSDGEIPPELEEEEEELEADWQAQQLEAAEMADKLPPEPKRLEKKTSFVRLKRRSRFEEKETELPDYATVRKKGVSAKTARGKRTKGKSYDIPTMVAHLSAAVRVYGPEEPNSSSDSESEEDKGARRAEQEKPTAHAKVDILSHIKAWSHPENISTPVAPKEKPPDLPQSVGKAKTHKEFFETGEHISHHLKEEEEEEEEEEKEKKEEEEEGKGVDQTEEEYLQQFAHLLPGELADTMQRSYSPTTFDAESLLHQSGQYNLGNSYRLEDLMSVNSEEMLLQWSTSPVHQSDTRESKQHDHGPHFSPTLPTQPEYEEDEEDSIPMSMI